MYEPEQHFLKFEGFSYTFPLSLKLFLDKAKNYFLYG